MTSKCGKNKVTHERSPSVSPTFLPHFDVFCDLLLNRRTLTWNLFVLYNNENPFISKYFNIRRKPASSPPLPTLAKTREETFDIIYYLYKVKQFHWLLVRSKELRLVEENHATVKPGSKVAPRGLKRFELQNLKIL